jgi:hypothetical protein
MKIVLIISLATNLLALGMLLAWYQSIRNKGEGTARFLTGVARNAPSLGLRKTAWWFKEDGTATCLTLLPKGHVAVIARAVDVEDCANWRPWLECSPIRGVDGNPNLGRVTTFLVSEEGIRLNPRS